MKKIDTESEEIDETRYRNFMLLLYKDTDSYEYDEVMFFIRGNFKNYAYIEHKPESDEKKSHTHVIISLDNACTSSALAKRVGIPKNFVKSIRSLRASCRYLTHIDYDEKRQYNLTDVKVSKSFQQRYFKAFDDLMTDEEILSSIYQYIDDFNYLSAIELELELSKFVCSNSYDQVFKRYYNTIVKYITYKSLK